MSVENKEEPLVLTVKENQSSALEDPLYEHLKEKAKKWLSIPKTNIGHEMDSVFFNDERFELMIDTRGYKPEEVKCTVSPSSVEVVAQRQELIPGTQRCMGTCRSYQLPQPVAPLQAICCISADGILLITAPWQR